MSRRGFFPVVLATILGVTGGIATFQPALIEERNRKQAERLDIGKEHVGPNGTEKVVPPSMNSPAETTASEKKNDRSIWNSLGGWAWRPKSPGNIPDAPQASNPELPSKGDTS